MPIVWFNGTVALPKGTGLKLTFGSFPGGGFLVGSPERLLTLTEGKLRMTSPSTEATITDERHFRK
jgi:hypothetical protein